MSDEKPNPSEKPSGKTSSVPLKKETVRITLRKDATGSAPPPPAPGAPPAPKPPATPAAPAPPLGAKTVPLTPAPPVAAQTTVKLTPTGGSVQPTRTQPLPKATVKLQPAQSPGATGGAGVAPITTGKLSGELDDDSAEAGVTPFAAIALVMALAAFSIGLMTSQNVFEQDKKTKEPSYAVPYRDYKHGNYEKVIRTGKQAGQIDYSFVFDDNVLPEIKEYQAWKKQQL